MSYFSPDVIILILGPWFGIFYYSVDLWWVSDPVWSKGATSMIFNYKREDSGEGLLLILGGCGKNRQIYFKG